MIYSDSDSEVIACKLSHELSKCKRWLVGNKLSLHVGKTECILIRTNGRLKGNETYNVTYDGMAVYQVTSVKYLGVTLDQNFKFSDHISLMIKQVCIREISRSPSSFLPAEQIGYG